MGKLVAAIAFLAVTALPATALAQPHWRQSEEAQVTVYLERTRVGAENWSYLERAGAEWAQPPHRGRVREALPLELRLREGLPGALEAQHGRLDHLGLRPQDQHRLVRQLHLNTRHLTSAAARRKTACHELGHVLGLEHRRSGKTCMRDGFDTMYGHPDDYVHRGRCAS